MTRAPSARGTEPEWVPAIKATSPKVDSLFVRMLDYLSLRLTDLNARFGSDHVHFGIFGRLAFTGFLVWVFIGNGIFGLLLAGVSVPILSLIFRSIWSPSHEWHARERVRREIARNVSRQVQEEPPQPAIATRQSVPRRW